MEKMNSNHPWQDNASAEGMAFQWGDTSHFVPDPDQTSVPFAEAENPVQAPETPVRTDVDAAESAWKPEQPPVPPVDNPPPEATYTYREPVPAPVSRSWRFRAGGKELLYGFLAVICSFLLCNFTVYGGFNLGFGIAMSGCILCATGYLLASGGRLNVYSTLLLLLSIGISAGYGRSDDGFVKFVMAVFLIVSVNLGLCLVAGQNRRNPGGVSSLGDVLRTLFTLGYGQIPRGVTGFFAGLFGQDSLAKKIGAILIGVLIMLPVLGILLPLLIKADVAFEGLMKNLPNLEFGEVVITVLCAVPVFFIFYSRSVALANRPKREPVKASSGRGINSLTVNTVLSGVCVVYVLYLISQIAYFVSGFAGIVPGGYTVAEYARRGFFEMALICAVNMGIIVAAVALVRKKEGSLPGFTKVLCLFIGLVTLFIVAAASAKMATYIGSFGLTRKRVLTQLIIVYLGIAALTVSVNLFMKKPRYMPVLLIAALLLGGSAFWVDVDTVVAAYNVTAYQKGILKTVDVDYLGTLSNGAVPYIAKLTEDKDSKVADQAQRILRRGDADWEDFRDWNYADALAKPYLPEEKVEPTYEENEFWDDDFFSDEGWDY